MTEIQLLNDPTGGVGLKAFGASRAATWLATFLALFRPICDAAEVKGMTTGAGGDVRQLLKDFETNWAVRVSGRHRGMRDCDKCSINTNTAS